MEEVPFEDRIVPRAEVDWDRSTWWWFPLSRAIHPAVRMTSLFVSLVALWVIHLGIYIADRLFHPSMSTLVVEKPYQSDWVISQWFWLVSHARTLIAFQQVGMNELAYLTFVILWLTLTGSLLGGVLVRRAAVELGQRTIAPWGESFRIVFSRWLSYLWVGGMHLVAIAALLIPVVILGYVTRFGAVGITIAGVLLLLSFPLVFAIGRMTLSLLVCIPLSVCSISVEKKADAFEGFSRSNAYFFQRPVVAVLCVLVLGVFGEVGAQLVAWTLGLGWTLVSESFIAAGGQNGVSNPFVALGQQLTEGLIFAYRFSYFWSATAALYLILRRCVDNTELDEIEVLESEIERSLPDIPTTSQSPNASSNVEAAIEPDQSATPES